jgi:PEP-CTERM motif
MNRRSCRSAPWLVMAIALPLFSQSAKATAMSIVFGCPGAAGACAGTISEAGGNAKTNGLGVTVANTFGPDQGVLAINDHKFHLVFNTFANTLVTLTEFTGSDGSFLSGHYTSKTIGPGSVALTVVFTTLPSEFVAWLGGSGSGPFAFDGSVSAFFNISGGAVTSSTVTINPTPEPATYLLMGTGMLLCALVLRRTKSTRRSTLAA